MKSASLRSTWAVVPVKPFALAKRRLAPALGGDERTQLARLMLEDVLAALAACPRLAGTLVVTCDRAVGRVAHAHGAEVFDDPATELNAAIDGVGAFLRREGDRGMIVVPADIPLLPPPLVESLIDRIADARTVALVPATRDGGTNLLACRPADAIRASFGPHSFRRHWQAAREAGLPPSVMNSEDAGLDIDLPEDLAAFLSRLSNTRSHAFLAAHGVAGRIDLDAARNPHRHTVKA